MDIRPIFGNILAMADECRKRGMSVEIRAGCASLCACNPYDDDEDDDDDDVSGFFGRD